MAQECIGERAREKEEVLDGTKCLIATCSNELNLKGGVPPLCLRFSPFLALLALLLLLRERVHHEELSVGWIPLYLKIVLDLRGHQNRSLESLHDRNVDIGFVFLVSFHVWSR